MRVACARPSLARCLLSVAVCALYEVRCCVASQDTTTSNALYTVVGGWTGDGGLASQAALYGARSVWHAPSAGALLVAEFWGHRVRTLWLHNGTIATLAGSARGVGGFAGDAGRATDALLLTPSHASMDEASGRVFISDTGNHRVRVVTLASGVIHTFAGNGDSRHSGNGGSAMAAGISSPACAIWVAHLSALLIAERGAARVRIVTLDGVINTWAGKALSGVSGDGGLAIEAQLTSPTGLAYVPATQSVLITDTTAQVRIVNASGYIDTFLGCLDAPRFCNVNFPRRVVDVSVDATAGDVCITQEDEMIMRFAANGSSLWNASNVRVSVGVACMPDGSMLASEYYRHRINAYLPNGTSTLTAGAWRRTSSSTLAADSLLYNPGGLHVAADGTVLVADSSNHFVRKLFPNGTMSIVAGKGASATSSSDGDTALTLALNGPLKAITTPDGGMYIADGTKNRVLYVAPNNSASTLPLPGGMLMIPSDLVLLANGSMLVSSRGTHTVLMVHPDGGALVVVGAAMDAQSTGDGGPASLARLNAPLGLCMFVDAEGGYFISEFMGDRVRRVDGSGRIDVFAIVSRPWHMVQAANTRMLYVSSYADHVVHVFAPDGSSQLLQAVGGTRHPSLSPPVTTVHAPGAHGLALDSAAGTLYFSTEHARSVQLVLLPAAVVLVGVPSATLSTCTQQALCANMADALALHSHPRTFFQLVTNITLSAPLYIPVSCQGCTLTSPAGTWLLLNATFPGELPPRPAGDARAVIECADACNVEHIRIDATALEGSTAAAATNWWLLLVNASAAQPGALEQHTDLSVRAMNVTLVAWPPYAGVVHFTGGVQAMYELHVTSVHVSTAHANAHAAAAQSAPVHVRVSSASLVAVGNFSVHLAPDQHALPAVLHCTNVDSVQVRAVTVEASEAAPASLTMRALDNVPFVNVTACASAVVEEVRILQVVTSWLMYVRSVPQVTLAHVSAAASRLAGVLLLDRSTTDAAVQSRTVHNVTITSSVFDTTATVESQGHDLGVLETRLRSGGQGVPPATQPTWPGLLLAHRDVVHGMQPSASMTRDTTRVSHVLLFDIVLTVERGDGTWFTTDAPSVPRLQAPVTWIALSGFLDSCFVSNVHVHHANASMQAVLLVDTILAGVTVAEEAQNPGAADAAAAVARCTLHIHNVSSECTPPRANTTGCTLATRLVRMRSTNSARVPPANLTVTVADWPLAGDAFPLVHVHDVPSLLAVIVANVSLTASGDETASAAGVPSAAVTPASAFVVELAPLMNEVLLRDLTVAISLMQVTVQGYALTTALATMASTTAFGAGLSVWGMTGGPALHVTLSRTTWRQLSHVVHPNSYTSQLPPHTTAGAVAVSTLGSPLLLTIADSEFVQCGSTMGAGGLAARALNSDLQATFTRTTFKTVRAGTWGGAALLRVDATSVRLLQLALTVRSTTFRDAEARLSGGALALAHASVLALNVEDSTFEHVHSWSTQEGDGGGAVWHGSLSPMAVYLAAYVKLVRVHAHNSTARYAAGGFIMSRSSYLVVEDCQFANVQSGAAGGAFYLIGASLEATRVRFSRARAIQGGAIASFSASVASSVTDAVFEDCEASSRGGAILLDASSLTLANSTLRDCVAGSRGGGIFASSRSSTLQLQGVVMARCIAGGTLLQAALDSNATVDEYASGGGVHAEQVALLTASNTSWLNCSAGLAPASARDATRAHATLGTGGGIALVEPTGVAQFEACVWDACAADVAGGAVYVSDGSLNMTSSTLLGCTAATGGGLALMNDGGATVSGSNITQCHAYVAGGAVFADAMSISQLSLDGSVLRMNNSAGEYAADQATGAVRIRDMLDAVLDMPPRLIPGRAHAAPLFLVHVLDAFNNTVVLDSSTTCQLRVEAPPASVGAPPMWQLRGRTDFVAVRGVVTVSGVTVTAASVGGGSSGSSSSGNESDGYIALHLRCLLSSLGMNADLSRTAQVLSVRAAWTLPPPDLILASSTQLREGVAASRLGVFVSDGTPLPLVDAVCSVSVRLLRVASSDPSAPLAAEVRLLSAPMMGYRWYNTTTDGTFMSEASRDVLSSALAWGVADTASSTVTVLAAPTWAANLPPILRTTWNSTLQSLPAPTLHEIILDSIFVDAPFGAEMRLCAQCTLPDVDAPPSLCWKLRTHDVVARVHGRPPARIAPSDVFNMSLHVHDGFSGAVMDMDNATACAVTVRWTSTSAATNASVDELTRVIGGSATAINGQLHFPTLQLSSRSNEHVKLKVTCTRGGVTVPLLAADTTHAMYVTACPAGFVTPPGGYGCTQCPDGTYTDGVGETECIACPPLLATCVGGRIAFSAAPVFISPASITYTNASTGSIRLDASLDVYECWNTEACDFDTSSRSFSCAYGYSGPLCGVCDASVGYVQQGAACIACPSEAVSMLVLVLLVAAILGLLVYVTVFKRADPTNQTAVLFRITVTYLQMLGSLGIFKARGTSTFRQLLGMADTVSTSLFASAPVACLLRPSFYAQFSAMMALPLIAVLLGVLIKAVFTMLQTRSCAKLWQYVVRREFMAPAVVVLYTTYPLLVTQTLRALNCRAQPVAGVRYLVVDLSVPCGTSAHTIVVAVAAVILALFGAGIPALIVCLLRRRRLRLHEEESVAQFGFLYSGYDVARGMYWWEALVLARKAGVVLLASLISDAYISTFAAIIVTFLALCAHALFRPYRSQLFNLLEGGSLATLCVTQMVCILYLRTEQLAADGTSGVSALAADAAISAVLLTMNAGMALLLLGVGARLLTQRHAAAIERVAKRVPCCARLLHSRLLCACCKAVLPPEETRAALHDATAAAAQHLKLAPPHVMSLAEYRQPPRSRMATTLAGSSDGPNIVHTPVMSLAAAGWSVRNPLAAGGAANAHATTASPELNDVATRAAAKVSRTAFPPATRV